MNANILEIDQLEKANQIEAIYSKFSELNDGESFVVKSTADTSFVIYELNEKYNHEFRGEALTSGPTEWQLKITKQKAESCCGSCQDDD